MYIFEDGYVLSFAHTPYEGLNSIVFLYSYDELLECYVVLDLGYPPLTFFISLSRID